MRRQAPIARAILLLLPVAAISCVGPGLLTDGSSVSIGSHRRGALRRGTALPFRGEGFVIPQRWRERRRNFGTDELVQLIRHASRQVLKSHRHAILGIGDLSPRGGGSTPEHLSHRSGRDVDLFFYARTLDGKSVVPNEMIAFDAAGDSQPPKPDTASDGGRPKPDAGGEVQRPLLQKFDVPANWALVKALVTHPEVHVQWVFMGRPLAQLLLEHAKNAGEPQWIIERASAVLHQPSDAQTHMDHLHVRVFCDPSDRRLGCVDRGPARWLKKTLKYFYVGRPPLPLALGPLRRCPLVRLTLF